MKAIILAAGRGTRMKELTQNQPKCLVKVRGRPLLEWQLSALRDAGITEIGIVTGYKRELLADWGLVEFYNPRWAETNMVSSLACAQEWLQVEPCIVSYSDIFYEATAVRSLCSCDAKLALTYDPNWIMLWSRRFRNPLDDAETFRLGPDGYLADIGNSPATLSEVQGQYMGLLRFTPAGWLEVIKIRRSLAPAQCDTMHMTETLREVINRGTIAPLPIPYTGIWGEVDAKSDVEVYNQQS